jgi:hypothetical protein
MSVSLRVRYETPSPCNERNGEGLWKVPVFGRMHLCHARERGHPVTTAMRDSEGRRVLDRPVKPGDEGFS